MKNLSVVLVLLLTLTIFQSCVKEKDTNPDNGVAPSLPPAESFIIPFTGYENADTTGFAPTGGGDGSGAEERTPTFQNWFHGATNVLIWHSVVQLHMIIPTAAFLEAFNHDAVPQGNGVWLWSYSFTGDANITYTAKLYGEILNTEEVKWDMYISRANGFQDVLWYTGITSATEGNWTINHQPNNPQALLKIKHLKDNGSGQASLRYTNIIPNDPNNGNYVEYRKDETGAADFNRAFDLYQQQQNHLIEIQWNQPQGNGRVKDAVRFGDSEWHCWDENKQDIDC
jgi:hypothetical protein